MLLSARSQHEHTFANGEDEHIFWGLKGASNVARGGIFFMGSQVMLLKLPVEEIKRSVTDTTVSTWTPGPPHHVEQPHQGSEVVEKLALLSQTPDAISPNTRNTGDLFLCHARCVPRVRRNSLHAMTMMTRRVPPRTTQRIGRRNGGTLQTTYEHQNHGEHNITLRERRCRARTLRGTSRQ